MTFRDLIEFIPEEDYDKEIQIRSKGESFEVEKDDIDLKANVINIFCW